MATKVQEKRAPKPTEMLWLTPYLTVRDIPTAMDFYEKMFGFEKHETIPGEDGRIVHGSMKYHDSVVVMFGIEGAFGEKSKSPATSRTESPVGLYVYCDDVDALYTCAKEGGAEIISEPKDMFWGDRIVQFRDPDGYRWTFARNVADFDASKQPECSEKKNKI
jgi:PhnB protein